MRVLYLTHSYSTHDRRMLAKIAEAGHEALFLRLQIAASGGAPLALPKGVGVVEWGGNFAPPAGVAALLPCVPQLLQVLEQFQPDLLHAGPLHTGAFLAALCGFRPMVAMSWAWDILQEAKRSDLACWATRYALQHADAVICDCNTVAKEAGELGGVPASSIVCFPWGTDLGAFTPALPQRYDPIESSGLRIVCNRSWSEGYGVDTALEAFEIARKTEPRLSLVLIGDGPLAAQIRAFIAERRLEREVSTPGRVNQEELPSYLQQADIYLSCSPSDGSSVSLLEALACGLPVVVADAPGNREWVVEGENGWLRKAGDAEGFAAALLEAVNVPAEVRRAIGERNRRLAEARADWRKNSEGLVRAYEMAMTRNIRGIKNTHESHGPGVADQAVLSGDKA